MDGLTDVQRQFLSILEVNLGNVSETCKATNVGRTTYYGWLEADESNNPNNFAQAVNDIKEGLIDRAESVLYGHLFNERSLDAAKYYLSRKGKGRGYVEKMETDNKNEHSGSVAVIVPNKVDLPDSVGNR